MGLCLLVKIFFIGRLKLDVRIGWFKNVHCYMYTFSILPFEVGSETEGEVGPLKLV